jgi:hypothetical protein
MAADPPRLVSTNPYGSMRAWLDDDGVTVYLHMGRAADTYISEQSMWVRNNGIAPELIDVSALAEGARLPQPRRATRHPHGKPLLPGQVLELLWFEEGDMVALFVDGEIEAILPSWSGYGEVRGYAIEARGRGPLAWELVHPNPLSSRAARARAHWDALNQGALWPILESADLDHAERCIGERESVWNVNLPGHPPRAVGSFRPLRAGRARVVYTTLGMSGQPMPLVEAEQDDYLQLRRVQVAMATAGDDAWVSTFLGDMARYPWNARRWIGEGHAIEAAGIDPVAAPGRFPSVLLLSNPPADQKQQAPNLAGHRDRTGDPITYLWAIPITAAERGLVDREGPEPLVARLRAAGCGWIHDPARPSVVDNDG